MRTRSLPFLALLPVSLIACSDPAPATPPSIDAGADASSETPAADLAQFVDVPCTDSLESIYGAPPADFADKPLGAVLRCAPEEAIGAAEIDAILKTAEVDHAPSTSGARVYRILYRTERGTNPPIPGYATASVLMPDTPIREKPPIVDLAHGTAGQAGRCAPSRAGFRRATSAHVQFVLPHVGRGFAVVAPDYSGYANWGAEGNPPSGYASAADVGKSVLDAGRAIRALAGSRLGDEIVLTGQSQGGHSAFSALSLLESYGTGGTVKAVVAHAPLWFSQSSWGAMLFVSSDFPLARNPFPAAIGVWYHYTNAWLLDGKEKALDVFAPEKRAAVEKFVSEVCVAEPYTILQDAAAEPKDLYTQDFFDAVAATTAIGGDCPSDRPEVKALCEKWIARYRADRPRLPASAAAVPTLITYGANDETIPADRLKCATDRLKSDKKAYDFCFDPVANHNGILKTKSRYALDWMAAKVLGKNDPGPCAQDESAVVKDGAPAECATLPPND